MKMADLNSGHLGRTIAAINPDTAHNPPCEGVLTGLNLRWRQGTIIVNEAVLDHRYALVASDELELL
ncbi:MAG: hypothetical protein WC322_02955 [Candidatus Paceibacterota bacterium]|jgi:hypothetical protein